MNSLIKFTVEDKNSILYQTNDNRLHLLSRNKNIIDLPIKVEIDNMKYHNDTIIILSNNNIDIYDLKGNKIRRLSFSKEKSIQMDDIGNIFICDSFKLEIIGKKLYTFPKRVNYYIGNSIKILRGRIAIVSEDEIKIVSRASIRSFKLEGDLLSVVENNRRDIIFLYNKGRNILSVSPKGRKIMIDLSIVNREFRDLRNHHATLVKYNTLLLDNRDILISFYGESESGSIYFSRINIYRHGKQISSIKHAYDVTPILSFPCRTGDTPNFTIGIPYDFSGGGPDYGDNNVDKVIIFPEGEKLWSGEDENEPPYIPTRWNGL